MQTFGRFNQSSADIGATFSDFARKALASFALTKPLPLPSIPEMPTSTVRLGTTASRFLAIASTPRLHGTAEELPFDSLIRLCVLCCDGIVMKRERDRIHAVAQPSRRWSVSKYMSEMRSAARARNFYSEDRRRRAAFVNRFFADWLPETRPA